MKNLRSVSATSFVVLLMAVAFVGCGDDANNGSGDSANPNGTSDSAQTEAVPGKPPKGPQTPVQLYSGVESEVRVKKAKAYILQSKADEAALRKQGYASELGEDAARSIAATDFKTRQAIGLFLPEEKAGTQMTVTTVEQLSNPARVRVSAIVLPPGKGCKVSGDPVHLFSFVETAKMEGKAVVKIDRQNQSPC